MNTATTSSFGSTQKWVLAAPAQPNSPTDPGAADEAHLADLEKLSGKAFDRLYIQEALRIDAEDETASDREKSETSNPAVKAFVGKFADMDAEHEAGARRLSR